MARIIDEIGNRYGRLIVVDYAGTDKRKEAFWFCRCDCGNTKKVRSSYLRVGHTKSCGCLLKEGPGHLAIGEAAFNTVLRTYQRNAEQRHLSFKLTEAEFRELTKQNCHYCGRKPEKIKYKKRGNYIYNGLDRMDNKEGYTIENVVPCCFICNRAKNSLSYTEFRNWIKQCVTHYLKEEERDV